MTDRSYNPIGGVKMVPENLKFTKEHEWVGVDGEIATMGISDYAQGELGDVVFVEMPVVGDIVAQFDSIGTIEAVKSVSDFFAPVSGEIVEVNTALEETPEIVNKEPYGGGWFVKIKLSEPSGLDNLISPEEYNKIIA